MDNRQLEEVHIDRQHLKPGEHFVLDPRWRHMRLADLTDLPGAARPSPPPYSCSTSPIHRSRICLVYY